MANVHTVLGIDPGLAAVGYGVLRARGSRLRHIAHGVIRTAANTPFGARLVEIRAGLQAVIDEYAPDEAAIEQLFFSRNVRTALPVAHARGVLILALSESGIPFDEYAPGAVKQAVAGQTRADKRQVVESVRLVLGMGTAPQSDHGADALAVALCHLNHGRVRAVLDMVAANEADRAQRAAPPSP